MIECQQVQVSVNFKKKLNEEKNQLSQLLFNISIELLEITIRYEK
jgi:hypothetical protein